MYNILYHVTIHSSSPSELFLRKAVWVCQSYFTIREREYCKLNRYVTDGIERRYEINRQRGTFWRHYGNSLSWQEEKKLEHRKASVRCKVEYVFHIVKDLFHWRKARYKGLKKNEDYAYLAFASANLYMLTCFA